jgi:type III restriction enzyme
LAHERYEELLAKAKALKEQLIDWRTVARPDDPAEIGRPIQSPLIAALTGGASAMTSLAGVGDQDRAENSGLEFAPSTGAANSGFLTLVGAPSRLQHAQESAVTVAQLVPREACGIVMVPVLEMEAKTSSFSLADVTDVGPFRTLGRQLRLDPEDVLRRTLLSARPVRGRDGITRIELDTRPAAEIVVSQGVLLSPSQARPELVRRLVLMPQVPSRASEMKAAEPLVDAFLDGLGPAVEHLGAYIDRAAGGLIDLVGKVATKKAAHPEMREVVRLEPFAPVRSPRPEQSADRFAEFRLRVGYRGWLRSMHDENWFDSKPERAVANAVDGSDLVACWARLLRNDLPILWNGMGNLYNPDFIVAERPVTAKKSGLHWIVEVKSEKDLASFDVQAKREAAERWAARVTADPITAGVPWRYLLLGEIHIAQSKGDWKAMRGLYTGR